MSESVAAADTKEEAEALVAAILNLRRIKCRVYGNHTEGGCGACGV